MLIHRSLSAHYHALIFQNARTFQNVKERGSEKMEKNQLADFQNYIPRMQYFKIRNTVHQNTLNHKDFGCH
jgi:hypothetical protein